MELRYGNKRLDLGCKRYAVECGCKQDIPAIIITLKNAFEVGELDKTLVPALRKFDFNMEKKY